jgi:hypothetical protein
MSKKIIAFSLLSLCFILWGCQSQNTTNNTTDCADWVSCWVNEVAEPQATNRTISEIEEDIEWFDETLGEIHVAEQWNGETIVIQWQSRDS